MKLILTALLALSFTAAVAGNHKNRHMEESTYESRTDGIVAPTGKGAKNKKMAEPQMEEEDGDAVIRTKETTRKTKVKSKY